MVFRNAQRVCLPIIVALGLALAGPGPLDAYVLPGQQVLAMMEAKRIAPQGLEVQQSVSQRPPDGAPRAALALRETLHFHFPDRVRADTLGEDYRRISIRTPDDRLVVLNGEIQPGEPERFEIFRDILRLETRSAMEAYLRQLDIDLDLTSLGRFEDNYCYVIGARYPDESAPQLWVQKDTFRPMRLLLPSSGLRPAEGALEVRFLDWGQIEGAVYPMLIQIYRKHQLFREMRVESLRVDPAPDPALFDTARLRATLPRWVPAPLTTPPAPTVDTPLGVAE